MIARRALLFVVVVALVGAHTLSSAQSAQLTELSARAAILVEAPSGRVVYQLDGEKRLPIASTTKLMTALLTLERVGLSDFFAAADYSPRAAETVIDLGSGERMQVADLLKALLLASANDAAITLADGVAGSMSAFVRLMNERASSLGLKNTHYSTPVGLDRAGNFSSAHDLATLSLTLRRHRFFRTVVDLPSATLKSGSRIRTIVNRNSLVRTVSYVNGTKTGHTLAAGYVLVASATKNGLTFISVVLGEPSESARNEDTLKLLRYGFASYTIARPVRHDQAVRRVTIRYSDHRLPLVATREVTRSVRRGTRFYLSVRAPSQVTGPIVKGSRVGTADVKQGEKVVARVPLVAGESVPGVSFLTRVGHAVVKPVPLVVLLVLGIGTLLVLRLRLRRRRRR